MPATMPTLLLSVEQEFWYIGGRHVMVVVDEIVILHRPKKGASHTPAKC